MLDHVFFLNISEGNLFVILKHFIFLLIFSSGRSCRVGDSVLGLPILSAFLSFFFFPQNLNVQTCYLLSYGKCIQSTDIYSEPATQKAFYRTVQLIL